MMTHNLNKDIIFSQTSPENIYLKFLNLNEIPKGNISSPFSEDKNPSFKLYKSGRFNCFSTGRSGDVIQFVADLHNLDCKSQFQNILEIIVNELNLDFQISSKSKNVNSSQKEIKNTPTEFAKDNKTSLQNSKLLVNTDTFITKPKSGDKKVVCNKVANDSIFKIDYVSKIEFQSRHLEFWEKLGVSLEILNKYNVKPISSFGFYSSSKEKNVTINYSIDEIAFCYEVNSNYEIYIPEQKTRKKYFCNGLTSDDIFGLQQIESKVENIIICAGKKDALTAIARGFNAISFRSETQRPTQEHIQGLQKVCNNLFICYDNDNGGEIGTKNIISQFPQIISLPLPKSYNDIADYFIENSQNDFQQIIDFQLANNSENDSIPSPESLTIFHIVEDYLKMHYDLRFNKISIEIEISPKNKNEWFSCNENSLWLELQKKKIKIPINSLIAILKSNYIPEYNPIVDYFETLPKWDKKTDFIKSYLDYVELEKDESREQFEYHFKKWCVRAIKCAMIDGYFNKQAFVLTDDGNGQDIGKSSWCRFLCPADLSNYLAEDMNDDKDARILLCKNFLINLDELAALSRKEINQLKSYFSKAQINERLPYDKKNSVIPRVASFIGSTNMSTFLQDETGSVRWLCFVVKSINWNYKIEFNIDNLWSQAYSLSKDNDFDETLSVQDIRQNELRNDKFQIVSPEKDLILKHFCIPTKIQDAEFLTSTDILYHLNLQTVGIRLSSVGIGKALKAIGFKRDKHNQVYGYWVEKRIQ
jgi:predicted P-loop ATPase/5S rRNA maturation endonuclease (ribonuclease M5)